MQDRSIRKISAAELPMLAELFEYRSPDDMIAENTRDMQLGKIDIFCLFVGPALAGELRVMYTNEDERMAVKGRRAYLYAFRVSRELQGKGLGKYLLGGVIKELEGRGYTELTVGIEDDNKRAIHMYKSFGFDDPIERKQEEYQGCKYEYTLYLRTRRDETAG